MTERFTVEFDGHQYFLVIDNVNERCLARLDTRFDALAWLETYKMLSEENEQLKEDNKILNRINDKVNGWNGLAHDKIFKLEKENEQLKKDLIDHSALISMLEDYQALKIGDTLYNLTDAKSEEEFNELYKPYLEKAKRCWR